LSQEAAENLTIVHQSGRHLAALIDDILDLSAIESGELRLTRTQVDVLEVAQTVIKEIHVTAQAKGLQLRIKGEHVMAWADQRRLRQIINNVVGNAVKFTQQGHVSVEVSRKGRRTVQIAVSDTGPGIAPGDQASIFEEYRQSGEQRWRRSGTGLGLAISRRLIEMHGGTIRLESTLGRGSTFTLLLPSQHDTERREDEPRAESTQATPSSEGLA
jgi:signal transduction histidine kinase